MSVRVRSVRRALEAKLGPAVEVRPGELEFNCPFCRRRHDPDPSHHLGVNLDKRAYHCFRCGAKGPLASLLGRGGRLQMAHGRERRPKTHTVPFLTNTAEPTLQERLLGRAAGSIGKGRGIPNYISCATPVEDVQSVEAVYNHRIVSQYAGARGVDPKSFPCGSSVEIPARLIWPITQEGSLVYYQARAVREYMTPKTLNPDASWGRKSDVLWGFNLVGRRRDVLAICEGPFDAVAVWTKLEIPAVAVLGSEISEAQARLIDYLCPGQAVVLFDADAGAKAKASAYRLRRVCRPSVEVSYVVWPVGEAHRADTRDPDSLSQRELQALVNDWQEAVG